MTKLARKSPFWSRTLSLGVCVCEDGKCADCGCKLDPKSKSWASRSALIAFATVALLDREPAQLAPAREDLGQLDYKSMMLA
jgi:hypothetical protein